MSDITFTESIFKRLKDKFVEIHTGDTRKTHQYSDYTLERKSVIRGHIVGAEGDLLIVRCITKNEKETLVYINGWGITVITEYEDSTNVTDIYQDEDKPLRRKK